MLYDTRFGDVRSLLEQRPTRLTFARIGRALCDMWEEAPERTNEEAMPYILRRLETWPAEVRAHPKFFLNFWHPPQPTPFGPLRAVRVLDLSHNYLGDGVCASLAHQRVAAPLEVLDLCANELTISGCADLAEASHLHGVKVLKLGANPIGDEGLRVLARSELLRDVEVLHLWDIRASDDGILALTEAPLTRLRAVVLSENTVLESTRHRLQRRFEALDHMEWPTAQSMM